MATQQQQGGSSAGGAAPSSTTATTSGSSAASQPSQTAEIEPLIKRLRDGDGSSINTDDASQLDALMLIRADAASHILDIIESWLVAASNALSSPSPSAQVASHYVRIITALISTIVALLAPPGPEVQVPASQQQQQRHAAAVAEAKAKDPNAQLPPAPPMITPPPILKLVGAPTQPVFDPNSPAQRLRLALVEILHRTLQAPPHAVAFEATRVLAPQTMYAVLDVLRNDNEANGVLAIKTIIDLHRLQKTVLEHSAQPFLDLIKSYYMNMRDSINSAFGSDTPAPAAGSTSGAPAPAITPAATGDDSTANTSSTGEDADGDAAAAASTSAGADDSSTQSTTVPASTPANSQTTTGTAGAPSTSGGANAGAGSNASGSRQPGGSTSPSASIRASASFKILIESPIAIVLVFQTYRHITVPAVQAFVPLVFERCLSIELPAQHTAHEEAKRSGTIFTGIADGVLRPTQASAGATAGTGAAEVSVNSSVAHRRQMYSDVILAQVKAMSFLAYVLRIQAEEMRPYASVLPGLCVRLLQDCPPEASSTRKELLVATRHILATDLRNTFVGVLDPALLDPDQRSWVGTGVASREAHRPLTISMLADLVHHVRAELSPDLLEKVVYLHAQILHDATLAPSIQTMCAKLLLNLVESVVARCEEVRARELLGCIVEAFIEKMVGLSALERTLDAARRFGERELKRKQQRSSSTTSTRDEANNKRSPVSSDQAEGSAASKSKTEDADEKTAVTADDGDNAASSPSAPPSKPLTRSAKGKGKGKAKA
ncbi:hypothetical protein CF326_g6730, partial [Tilletia indica]